MEKSAKGYETDYHKKTKFSQEKESPQKGGASARQQKQARIKVGRKSGYETEAVKKRAL